MTTLDTLRDLLAKATQRQSLLCDEQAFAAAATEAMPALLDIIEAQGALLVAYRLGAHDRADKVLTKLHAAKARLEKIQ